MLLGLFVFENLCAACMTFWFLIVAGLVPQDVCEDCRVQYEMRDMPASYLPVSTTKSLKGSVAGSVAGAGQASV